MQPPTHPRHHDVFEFLSSIRHICHTHNVTGIALVLTYDDGAFFSTHRVTISDIDLAIAGSLLEAWSEGWTHDFTEH